MRAAAAPAANVNLFTFFASSVKKVGHSSAFFVESPLRTQGNLGRTSPSTFTERPMMAKMPKYSAEKLRKARVLIVEDQPLMRERLAELISSQADLTSCGDTDSPRSAIALIATTKPNLILTGLALQESHGLEFIKDLRVRYPRVPVLVFSMYDESLYAERAMRAGASGFVSKYRATNDLLCAIRRVLDGGIYLSERVTGHAMQQFFARSPFPTASERDQLSDRELEVFELIGLGRSSRQIASALHLSVKTVETYRSRIKTKLKVTTATELAQHAWEFLHHAT
jgi:DNA-binding NarL/FixJ family response regulator